MSDIKQAVRLALDALLIVRNNSSVSMHQLAIISPAIEACRAALAEPVAIHQWRNRFCSNWYDGHPDHEDGGGPYETRILYTAPEDAA